VYIIPKGENDQVEGLVVTSESNENNPATTITDSDIDDRSPGQIHDDWKTYWETSSQIAFRYPPQIKVRLDQAGARIAFVQDENALLFQLTSHLRLASEAFRLFEDRGGHTDTFTVVRIGSRLYASVELPQEDGCDREAYLVPRPNGTNSAIFTFRFCNDGALKDQRDAILGSVGFPDTPSYENWQTAGLKSLGIKLSYPKAFGQFLQDEDGIYHWVERLSLTGEPLDTFVRINDTCNGQPCELVKEDEYIKTFISIEGDLKGFIKLPDDQDAVALELRETGETQGLLRRILESVEAR